VDYTFTELGHDLYGLKVLWDERAIAIHLWYSKHLDLLGEASYLHPKAIMENVGIPSAAYIEVAHETFGFLMLEIPDKNTAVVYEVDFRDFADGSQLCMLRPEDEPDIYVYFSADSMDATEFYARRSDMEPQDVFTGVPLQDFLTELAVPGRCIPIQLPD
jgi:hypothetical protein